MRRFPIPKTQMLIAGLVIVIALAGYFGNKFYDVFKQKVTFTSLLVDEATLDDVLNKQGQ